MMDAEQITITRATADLALSALVDRETELLHSVVQARLDTVAAARRTQADLVRVAADEIRTALLAHLL